AYRWSSSWQPPLRASHVDWTFRLKHPEPSPESNGRRRNFLYEAGGCRRAKSRSLFEVLREFGSPGIAIHEKITGMDFIILIYRQWQVRSKFFTGITVSPQRPVPVAE
ncbi:MAG TPA: hypothetical protein VIQ75_07005, partial [Gammaproteobacteria bacterium]